MKRIEELVSKLPRYTADTEFKRDTYEKIMKNTPRHHQARHSRQYLKYALLTVAFAVLAVGVYRLTGNSESNIFRPAQVSAAEILQKAMDTYFRSGTIYHVKYRHFVDYKGSGISQPTVYELWDDNDSDRFYQEVSYPDGNRVWQGFDLDVRWSVDAAERVVYKDMYMYPDPDQREVPRGQMADLATQFRELIENGTLGATEGLLDTRPVYVVEDTRSSPDKFWDSITLDRETYAVLQLVQYNPDRSQTLQYIEYEVQEAIERSPQALSVFAYRLPMDGLTILERNFDINHGYTEDEYRVVEQSVHEYVTPTPEVQQGNQDSESGNIFPQVSLRVPEGWQVMRRTGKTGVLHSWVVKAGGTTRVADFPLPHVSYTLSVDRNEGPHCLARWCSGEQSMSFQWGGQTWDLPIGSNLDDDDGTFYYSVYFVYPDISIRDEASGTDTRLMVYANFEDMTAVSEIQKIMESVQ